MEFTQRNIMTSAWIFRSVMFTTFISALVSVSQAQVQPIDEIFEPSGTFDEKTFGKVAVVQWNGAAPTPIGVSHQEAEDFKQSNRDALENYIREAAQKGAKLVVTPEFSIVGYPDIPELPSEEDDFRNRADIEPYVEAIPGPSTNFFGKLAKELNVYIHIGFAEVDPKTDKYYNAVVAIGPDGLVKAVYRKINLYELENDFLSPGTSAVTYDGVFGKVGLIACSDVYSSNPMNNYRDMKVDLMALGTSWAAWNSGWSAFVRGAKWVSAPLLAANQTYFPDSGVINADGSTQSHIRQSNGLAYGYIRYKKLLH